MTYNPERISQNGSISNALLDKCLIYYLDSFINNKQSISQIIFGFLVNSNCLTNVDLNYNISSKIPNIHDKIMNKLEKESEKVTERTIIKFCNSLISSKSIKELTQNIKNNFLYFYFPSGNVGEFEKIINDSMKEEGVTFNPLANNFRTECKESLDLITILEKNIKNKKNDKFELGKFIFYCLNIPFKYLEDMQKTINDILIKANESNYDGLYLPLKTFNKYLDKINDLYKNQTKEIMNNIKIREVIDIPNVRMLLLFEKLHENNDITLLSWEGIDILYQNINIFNTFTKLSNIQNLESLGQFFDEIIKNIKYIKDIIEIFPYSLFKRTKFSLINDIISNVIKNTFLKKMNFTITIKEKKYKFEYSQNDIENLSLTLDLDLNDNKELIITDKIEFCFILKNKKSSLILQKEKDKIEKKKLNQFYLILIEKFLTSKNYKSTYKSIYKDIPEELKENTSLIKYNFNFQSLFKNNNNLVVYLYSILFLIDEYEKDLDMCLKKF